MGFQNLHRSRSELRACNDYSLEALVAHDEHLAASLLLHCMLPEDKAIQMEERQELAGYLARSRIYDECDAMAAVRHLLRSMVENAMESASPKNSLNFHLLGELHTFLQSRSIKAR